MLERAAPLTEGWAGTPWDAASGQPRRWRTCAARPTRGRLGVVGRGELELARASRREAPHASPYQRH